MQETINYMRTEMRQSLEQTFEIGNYKVMM